jgi:hypothetical protein
VRVTWLHALKYTTRSLPHDRTLSIHCLAHHGSLISEHSLHSFVVLMLIHLPNRHQSPAFWHTRALLFNFVGKGPGFCFSRRPITGSPTSPRSPDVPPMTEVQAEALDMVHFLSKRHCLTMRLKRGDIQLINNLAVQHARDAFSDSTSQRRHIIRLWLRNEDLAWKTPAGLKATWFDKYGDSPRRRIAKWSVHPNATRDRVLFRSDSCS